jgi:hypothetical protein
MGSSSNPPQSTTVVNNNNEPAAWQKPLLQRLGSDTLDVYNDGGFDVAPYTGNTVIPYAQDTLAGQNLLSQLGNAGAPNIQLANQQVGNILQTGGISQAQQDQIANMDRIAGGQYRPEQQTGVTGLQQTASGDYLEGSPQLDRMYDQFATDAMRRVGDMYGASGRLGSGASTNAMVDALGDVHNQIYGQNYVRERGNQMNAQGQLINAGASQDQLAGGMAGQAFNALNRGTANTFQAAGMTPQMYTAQGLPSEFLFDSGRMDEDLASREKSAEITRYNEEQLRQYNELQRLNALASGAVQTGGSSTSTTQAPSTRPSTAASALGGAFSGAAAGNALFPGIGGIVGGIGGGLLGAFG